MVFFRHEDRAVFAFGFAKSRTANLYAIELRTHKRAAGFTLGSTQAQIEEGRLFEVNDDAQDL